MTKLPPFRSTVRPEWIDYNGHMSEAYYSLVFGHATDALMAETGLGPAYRESTRCSLYTVESHIRFLQDVPEAAHLAIRTRVLGVAARKAHFTHEMYVVSALGAEPPADALPVATTELLAVHVDQQAGRAAAFPDTVRHRFAELTEPPPAWAGRSIASVA
ncbi:thioesterase [Streptomyces sp. CAI-21]|uniref:thioesterase family protein n=1 Tax=Streptomyces TaxID=1883 RepID=UPI0008F52FC9|nr:MULTISPECIES: thioesterase family protein [Streptomyces]MBK3386108.1 thioesterase family protein [Streptomyces sp. DEF147AK]MBK3388154.1 thioesterase family protein [Streptomyces sp. DEF1AK]NUW08771.1 thioesterase [Streptomyces sp. CAI-21]WAC94609.1 thioesterase family protein [Streptomyces sp. NA13]